MSFTWLLIYRVRNDIDTSGSETAKGRSFQYLLFLQASVLRIDYSFQFYVVCSSRFLFFWHTILMFEKIFVMITVISG